ncbi:MAG TPA: DUF2288 domain-containing protein [Noviherbaspirillum sp.]|nr:DUF2288 domain-containing protein [Noviherbaspirillum sp.]
MSDPDSDDALLRAKLNGETSRMPWHELQRFFAGGSMIVVDDTLDLVEVALRIARDDKAAVAAWLEQGKIARASDEHARGWTEADASLWAVVVKPWVLVQREKRHAA